MASCSRVARRCAGRIVGLLTVAAIVCCAPAGFGAATDAKTVTIGAGSGYLDYPTAQQTLDLKPGDTLLIAPGIYTGISLANLHGTAAAPITIKCDPKTVFTSAAYSPGSLTNVSYATFRDFRYQQYPFRALTISGDSHDVLFKNFNVTNTGIRSDYFFFFKDEKKVFNGTKESAFYNFTWEDCVFDGCSPVIINDGSWADLKCLALDFEISRCTFKNAETTPIELNKGFNLKVHDCTFSDNGGRTFRGHMANITCTGYLKVYNNTFVRNWANDVRLMPMKLNLPGYNGPDAVGRFYNNISYEKKKYPVFEHNNINIKQADLDASSGYFSRTSSEVYFNTLYRSRKVDYDAHLVDHYGEEMAITVKYNLVIEPEVDVPFDPKRNYVHVPGEQPQKGIVVENNQVYQTLAASGLVDAVKFVPSATSPAKDAATGRVDYITTDHDGNNRYEGAAADVGAIERQKQ